MDIRAYFKRFYDFLPADREVYSSHTPIHALAGLAAAGISTYWLMRFGMVLPFVLLGALVWEMYELWFSLHEEPWQKASDVVVTVLSFSFFYALFASGFLPEFLERTLTAGSLSALVLIAYYKWSPNLVEHALKRFGIRVE